MTPRLAVASAALVELIEHGTPLSLRSFAEACARLAIERTAIGDQIIEHALNKLAELNEQLARAGGVLSYKDDGAIGNLEARARVLDAGAAALARRELAAGKSEADSRGPAYWDRWYRARAVCALRCAFNPDPYLAAADSAWETIHALDDVLVVERLGMRLIVTTGQRHELE
jgi:hypothetical protein